MDDALRRLLDDIEAEVVESGEAAEPAGSETPTAVDRILDAYYAAEPQSAIFSAAVDALSEASTLHDAPAGRAAASASQPRSTRGQTVADALAATVAQVRGALVRSLHISTDAADLLLERPAAALTRYPADRIADVADSCGRRRGELFRAVADSARMSGGFVYPYRPGPATQVPAMRAAEEPDPMEELVAWGRGLFDAPSSRPQTSR